MIEVEYMGMCEMLQFKVDWEGLRDMRGKYKFSSVMASIVIVTFVAFIALVMVIISYATKAAYQVEKNAIYEEVVRFDKIQLETEANEIVDYIRLTEEKASNAMRMELKSRVDEAYRLAEQIYYDDSGELATGDIEEKIADALRDIRFDGGTGYLFMDRFDGQVMLYPIRPELEGTNVLDLKDDYGNFVIRDEINIARSYGSGYAEGHWIKPDQEDEIGSLKVSYIRKFEDLDWYIGTGIYEDEYLEIVKQGVLEDLSRFKAAARDHTFFISTYDGKLLLDDKAFVEEASYIDDAKLVIADQSETGEFLQESLMIDGQQSVMITYIAPVKSWGWIIGLESILNESITESKAYYLKGVIKDFNYTVLVLSSVLLISIMLFMKFVTKRLNLCFDTLKDLLVGEVGPAREGLFCFREFEDFAEHLSNVNKKNTRATEVMDSQPQFESRPIETIMEGEAIAVGLIQNLNDILASDSVDKMTEIKLSRIGSGMMSVRKLLTKMSQKDQASSCDDIVLNLEDIPLKAHLEQVMKLILHEYSEIAIESRVICDKDLIVYSDPLVLTQIITHLATNAIKHGFETNVTGSITIEVIYDVDYLRVYFSDNGRGMSQYVQERIFEPFYTTSGMQGDAGLGLSEVYSLVNDVLCGAVNCSSRVGFGTDFFIDIPGNGPGLWFDEPNSNEKSS